MPLHHLFTKYWSGTFTTQYACNILKQWEHKIPTFVNFWQVHSIHPSIIIKRNHMFKLIWHFSMTFIFNPNTSYLKTSYNMKNFVLLCTYTQHYQWTPSQTSRKFQLYTQIQHDLKYLLKETSFLHYLCYIYDLHHLLYSDTHLKKCYRTHREYLWYTTFFSIIYSLFHSSMKIECL